MWKVVVHFKLLPTSSVPVLIMDFSSLFFTPQNAQKMVCNIRKLLAVQGVKFRSAVSGRRERHQSM